MDGKLEISKNNNSSGVIRLLIRSDNDHLEEIGLLCCDSNREKEYAEDLIQRWNSYKKLIKDKANLLLFLQNLRCIMESFGATMKDPVICKLIKRIDLITEETTNEDIYNEK